jgi:hypothetical protein
MNADCGRRLPALIDAENMMDQSKSANQSAKISVPFLILLEYAITLTVALSD